MKLAISTWGDEEKQALLDVVDSGYMTMGEKVSQFEQDYAAYTGSKYCVACNSGSSANQLMVAAMTLRFGAGEVIVPALGWSTSYSPFRDWGWILKFVDIDKDTFNISPLEVAEAHVGHELVLGINIMGNPCDYNFPGFRLEDNCESMGAELEGGKTGSNKATGALMSSHSTYFSHHIQTMEGGMVTTDDEHFYQMLLCLRSHGWTRHLPEDNLLGAEVSSYNFIYPGYNVRPTEIQAAVGIEQVKKLPKFIEQRRANAEGFKELAKKRGWQIQQETGESSWFGFIIVSEEIEELKAELVGKNVDYRPVVGGNYARSPAVQYYDYSIHKDLPVTERVTQNGLYIGNNHKPIDWGIF